MKYSSLISINLSVNNPEISYSYSFTLRSTARALNLCDFPQIQLDYSGNGGDVNAKTNDDFSHRWLYLGLF